MLPTYTHRFCLTDNSCDSLSFLNVPMLLFAPSKATGSLQRPSCFFQPGRESQASPPALVSLPLPVLLNAHADQELSQVSTSVPWWSLSPPPHVLFPQAAACPASSAWPSAAQLSCEPFPSALASPGSRSAPAAFWTQPHPPSVSVPGLSLFWLAGQPHHTNAHTL